MAADYDVDHEPGEIRALTSAPLRQPSISDDMIRRAAGAVDMPAEQFEIFLAIAHRTGLDPLSHQIYAIPRKVSRKDEQGKWHTETTWTIQTGIDGYRSIAVRTRVCGGIDDPIYDTETADHPNKATATVWRFVQGQRVPFTASARWSEYVQTKAVYDKSGRKTDETEPTDMWKRMPYNQLGKCAEALALRRAFPVELSGTYTDEEMAQADNFVEGTATVHEEPAQPALPAPAAQPAQRMTVEERYEAEPGQRDAAAKSNGHASPAKPGKVAQRWSSLQLRMRGLGIIKMPMADEVAQRLVGKDWIDAANANLDTDYDIMLGHVEAEERKSAAAKAHFDRGEGVGVAPGAVKPAGHDEIVPQELDLADIETGHPVP